MMRAILDCLIECWLVAYVNTASKIAVLTNVVNFNSLIGLLNNVPCLRSQRLALFKMYKEESSIDGTF